MKVTVVSLSGDQTISLDVQGDLLLKNFRALCSMELSMPPESMLLTFNGVPLINLNQTLNSYGINDNDIILVQQGLMGLPGQGPAQGQTSTSDRIRPKIDFSSIKVPESMASSSSSVPRSSGGFDMSNPEALRQRFLDSPHDLALLKERNPVFADAVIKGGEVLAKQLEIMRETHEKKEREKIRLLNANPLDPEVQNKIAEDIRQQNIQENMNMAIEEAPESFGQVVMLWINIKVNGHSVKAFVDSGAQMTIMSAACAERCSIIRLVDRRWEGIAKGVGTQKIIGRIHLAQMQIENDFLACSFSVLEDQPMDVLLGLDMLRRHQCVIDLKANKLLIGTTGTDTKFLSESELPSHGRLHDPLAEASGSEITNQETEDERIAKALEESARESMEYHATSHSANASNQTKESISDQTESATMVSESNLKKVTDMGFDRADAERELRQSQGDVQHAIVKLLARSLKRN